MKLISLTLFSISLLILLIFYLFPINVIQITSKSDIKNLIPNQKVQFSGNVIQESKTNNKITLKLENNLTISCSVDQCPSSYQNKKVKILAKVQSYNNKIYLNFQSIEVIQQ